MSEFVPSEKGTTIRYPSTANLALNSLDRIDGTSSTNFYISKQTNILSGFFTRIALNEIVLDWSIPNVISGINNEFIVRIGSTNTSVLLETGFYTVKECVDALVVLLNTSLGPATFSITTNKRGAVLTKASGTFSIISTNLSVQLNCLVSNLGGPYTTGTAFTFFSPLLLNYKYIDFTSPQLTYNQNLKDSSTGLVDNTILYRWVFGWEGETLYDAYNYPIVQGYRAFLARRSIAFPKQIKWDNIQPIGQIQIMVVDEDGQVIPVPAKDSTVLSNLTFGEMEFNMNLLVSEV